MTKAIVRREPPQMGVAPKTMEELDQLARACVASGFFSDAKEAGQALIKIQAGAELGLPPVQSMTSINVIKGRITLSAGLMAALLKRAGYKIRVQWGTDPTTCIIRVYEGKELVGESSFSTQDARQAGLGGANWHRYPRNMLYARAISNAARWYAPEVLTGVYLPDELDDAPEDLRPAEPVVVPTGTAHALDPLSEPKDPGTHPGDAWKSANAAARGNLHGQGISEDERKMLIQHYWGRQSFTELRASHLKGLADAFNLPPTEEDERCLAQAMSLIEQAGGVDKLSVDDAAQMRDLCKSPWQVVLLDRALAGGTG